VSLKLVSFGTTKIQTLRRVALDQNLLDTLGLGIGDMVHIELDTEREVVIIKRVFVKSDKQTVARSTARRPRASR